MTIELNPATTASEDARLIPLDEVCKEYLRVNPRTGLREVAAGRLKVLYVGDRPFITLPMIRQYIADRIAEAAETRKKKDAIMAARGLALGAKSAAKAETASESKFGELTFA